MLISLCLGFASVRAPAEPPAAPRKVLVWALPGATTDAGLRNLLLMAVSVELERLGFEPEAGQGELDIQAAAQSARARGAMGFIVVGHAEQALGLRVDLSLYEATRGDLVARSTGAGRLDLEMDTHVAAAVRDVVSVLSGTEAPAVPVPVPVAVAEAVDQAAVPADLVVPAAPARARRLRVGLSGGVFLSAGETAGFFPMAPAAGLSLGLVPPILGDHLSLGLRLAVLGSMARGDLAGGQLVLVPLGLEIVVRGRESDPLYAYGSVAGGAALLRVTPSGIQTFMKAVPWAGAAIGVALRFGGTLGLFVEAGYTAYFERYAPIMGFTPLAGLYLAL